MIEVTMLDSGKKTYVNANYVTQILPCMRKPDSACYLIVKDRPTMYISGSASEIREQILQESVSVAFRTGSIR